jgi:type II secretory pathway component PulK
MKREAGDRCWCLGGPVARPSPGPEPKGQHCRRGFALVAALWLLVALGAVGLHTALASKARRQAAANLLDEVRARNAVVAGTEYARSRLTAAMVGQAEELRAEAMERARSFRDQRRAASASISRLFRSADPLEDPWREPQELVVPEMTFGDARYALLLRDVGAAMNLNEADEEMLRQFFSLGVGVDYADADALAQAILDWRDEDEIPRINGGEREEYLEEGALVLPPNRDFVDVDELRHVRGMTPEVYVAAAPHLTLIGDGQINLNSAPEPVLLALPGMDPGAVTQLLRLRDSGVLPRSDMELVALMPSAVVQAIEARGRGFSSRRTYTTDQVEILAQGWVDGGVVQVTSRVVVSRGTTEARVIWREVF